MVLLAPMSRLCSFNPASLLQSIAPADPSQFCTPPGVREPFCAGRNFFAPGCLGAFFVRDPNPSLPSLRSGGVNTTDTGLAGLQTDHKMLMKQLEQVHRCCHCLCRRPTHALTLTENARVMVTSIRAPTPASLQWHSPTPRRAHLHGRPHSGLGRIGCSSANAECFPDLGCKDRCAPQRGLARTAFRVTTLHEPPHRPSVHEDTHCRIARSPVHACTRTYAPLVTRAHQAMTVRVSRCVHVVCVHRCVEGLTRVSFVGCAAC